MHAMQVYREKDFSKGMDDINAPEHVQPGYLVDALNCYVLAGEIVKRNGYTIIGNDLGSTQIQCLKGVRFASGTKELFMVRNGTVYYWTGSGSWTSLGGTLNTTGYVEAVIANNAIYFFDGTNAVVKVNSSNVLSTVVAIPIGTQASWFHNMLFVTGVSGAPNDVRISNLGNPEDFSTGTTTTISVNPNDGDYITAFGEFNNELIVFKSQRVWSITGFGTAILTVSNLNERISGFGTIAPRSVVNVGSDLIYLSFLGDVPHLRSLRRTTFATVTDGGIISENIEATMDGLNKTVLDQVVGGFDGRNLWFAVPDGSSTFNNKVVMLDWITKGWVRHSGIQASCFESFAISNQVQFYFGEASADSKAYVFDSSTSDNGAAIPFQVISRRYGGGMPEVKKKWKWFYVTPKETGNYDLTVDMSRDGFTYENLGTVNLTGTGAVFDMIVLDVSKLGATDVKRKRFNLAKAVNFYTQFKLYESSTISSVRIRDWELYFYPKVPREI